MSAQKESQWGESKRSIHNGNRGFVKLTKDYWKSMFQTDKILGYWNNITRSQSKKGEPNAVPYYSRKLNLSNSCFFEKLGSTCDLVINDLYTDLKSRYRKGLDKLVDLVDAGIIEYNPRCEPTLKNKREAIRQRMCRDFYVSRYDTNLNILDEEFGLLLLERLKPFDQAAEPKKGSVYLSGYDSKHSTHILIYDTYHKNTGKHIIKVEVKLRRGFLVKQRLNKESGEKYNLRSPKHYVTQPEIQLKVPIEKELRRCLKLVFSKAGLEKELSEKLGIKYVPSKPTALYKELLDVKNTLTHIKASQPLNEEDSYAKAFKLLIDTEKTKRDMNYGILEQTWRLAE